MSNTLPTSVAVAGNLFVGVAVLSSLVAYILPFPLFRDISFTRNTLQAGLTLGVGVCMFLVTAGYPQDQNALKRTLGWINWGGLFIILWSLLQAFEWKTTQNYPDWMVAVQTKGGEVTWT